MTSRPLWLLLITLALASGCATHKPIKYIGLALHYPTFLALAREGAELQFETAWCLIGKVRDSTVVVEGVAAPMVANRTSDSANFSGCASYPGTVGWYHNHPPQPFDACHASPLDVDVFYTSEAYKVMLLSCEGGVFIYQLRDDPNEYRIDKSDYLPPA